MTATPFRIGFLSPHNPYDRRAFSGTTFYAAAALARQPGIDLRVLGAHRPPGLADRLLRRASPKLDRVSEAEIDGLDAVVGLVASQMIDRIRPPCDTPLIHVTDATPAFLREDYGWGVPVEMDRREARVLQRADAALYSSQEMADRAAREFDTETAALPFGINFDTARLPASRPEKPPLSSLNLLFVGNDWVRKGGEIAVAAMQQARKMGLAATLTVVGRLPEAHRTTPHITAAGYLNKNRAAQAAELARLYARAHLLLVPSRADCTPMVAAEAMSFGTPVLASDTGGLPSLLGGAGTGRLLPLAADGCDWARAIQDVTRDPAAYALMSEAGFDRARSVLTWDSWAAGVVARARDLAQARQRRAPQVAAA
ncbi:MAG: glycosyltransferase family 4 protein [Rhodobacter sp.]|nr:glycosyltransferase family 4 protein [Rhodobacter sp.]